jgi:hypothetical protein
MTLPTRVCFECLHELREDEKAWRCECGALVCEECTEPHLKKCESAKRTVSRFLQAVECW